MNIKAIIKKNSGRCILLSDCAGIVCGIFCIYARVCQTFSYSYGIS